MSVYLWLYHLEQPRDAGVAGPIGGGLLSDSQ